jgi:hypothetical protein
VTSLTQSEFQFAHRQLFDADSDLTYHFDAGSDLDPDPTMLENLKPFTMI